jgi:hypothetical protein
VTTLTISWEVVDRRPDHPLDVLIQRFNYLGGRDALKDAVGWDSRYEQAERDALAAVIFCST